VTAVEKEISDHTRKHLWTRSGDACAFTGCEQRLLHPTKAGDGDTVLGEESHIVAKRDHPSVARAPCLLSDEEKVRWAQLIDHRHAFPNLILMCRTHARLIDDPDQELTVEQVVEMKSVHEAEVEQRHRMELPGTAGGRAGTGLEQEQSAPRPLLLEDVPQWQRRAVIALANVDDRALGWLRDRLDSPAQAERLLGLVEEWPGELGGGPDELLNLLIREAESLGLWSTAADVWGRLAGRREGPQRADLLVRAAIDARIGGDEIRRDQLLDEAGKIDPDCVGLRLETADENMKALDRLALLATLGTDDPPLASMIACQRTLAYLLVADLESAEESLEEAQRLDPDSFAVQISGVNVEVQRARMALRDDKPFVIGRALDARDRALELRERLVTMGRWEESVRLLMMAAEIPGLMRDPESAQKVLELARPEEMRTRQAASVLGDAALRAGAAELALRFIEEAPADDEIARIRATAEVDLPGPQRDGALKALEELALGDSPESEFAAASRLVACMPPIQADWNEAVAEVLEDGPNHKMAASLRALTMASVDLAQAEELASELPDEAWGPRFAPSGRDRRRKAGDDRGGTGILALRP
jgi:tetratricopeptide (TPR) repeat protein